MRCLYDVEMDIRIGVSHSAKELNIELAEDTDRDELHERVGAALSGAVDVLWLTDRRGADVGIAAAKIAYVEIGSADAHRRIGFGS